MAKDYLLFSRYVSIQADTLLLDGLDATFTIEKNMQAEPNKCEVRVYNLSETNRRALQALKNIQVEIKAGYKGLATTPTALDTFADSLVAANTFNFSASAVNKDDEFRVFLGDVVQIFSQREGPDWVTTLRTADGMLSRQESRLNKTFAKSAPFKEIVKDLLNSLRVDVGATLKKFAGGELPDSTQKVLNSYTVFGSAHAELDKHLKKLNVLGFIEDNQLIVLKEKETLGTEAVRLTSDTGLLGSPELTNDGLLKCTTLIRPEIKLGHQIKVESDSLTGTYRVERLSYSASTFSQDWYIDIEATPL